MDLDDVYKDREQTPEEPEQQEVTGEESSPPEQVEQPKEPEVDWRAEAEKAKAAAAEAERKAKGLEQAIAAARARVRDQPQQTFTANPAEYVEEMRRQFDEKVSAIRVEALQAAARARHEDYEDKERVFVELAQSNPYLVAQLQQAQDPAEFAYKTAEYHIAMQEAGGSLDALKKRLSEELAQEKQSSFQAKAQAIPKTLAGATGTGRRSAQVFSGPTGLDDIYSRKR